MTKTSCESCCRVLLLILHQLTCAGSSYVIHLAFGVAYLHPTVVRMRPKHSDLTASARAMHGVELFFRNRFREAEDLFHTERNRLPLFALGWATMAYIKAIITFDAAVRLPLARIRCSRLLF